MMKLIKLELERNKLKPYIMASLLLLAFGFGFCFLTAYMPQLEPSQLSQYTDGTISTDISIFTEWKGFISLISLLFAASLGVLSAVMHAKFTVEEYTGKRAILLFSYPIKRSNILFAKCSLVFLFTVIAVTICNIAAIGTFALFSNVFHIMPLKFTFETLGTLFITTAVSALLSAGIGLVAMRIGFWRKSLIVTIITSFLLIIPLSNLMSFSPENSLLINLIGMGILLLLGLMLFLELLSKVNKMEAL